MTSESEFQPQKKVKCPFVDEEIIQVKQQHSEMLSWCSFDTYSIGWQGKENLPFYKINLLHSRPIIVNIFIIVDSTYKNIPLENADFTVIILEININHMIF